MAVFATAVGRPVRCDSGLELRGQGRLDTIEGSINTLQFARSGATIGP